MRLTIILTLGLSALAVAQEGASKPAAAQSATGGAKAAAAVDPALKTRVDAWWKARVIRDHKVMYDLMDPEYRGACSYEAFVAQNVVRTRFDILSHQVLSAEREGGRANVRIGYGAQTAKFGEQPMEITESWIQDPKGEWWKYWEPVATPFPTPPPAPGTPRALPCQAP